MEYKIGKNKAIELVGKGHPDRFADIFAAACITEGYRQDKKSRFAYEIIVSSKTVFISGEVSTKAKIDYKKILKRLRLEIYGKDYKWDPKIIIDLSKQSKELAKKQKEETVAGDQGIIYGYWDEDRFKDIITLNNIMEEVKDKIGFSNDWKLLFDFEKCEFSVSVSGIKKEKFKKLKKELHSRVNYSYYNKHTVIVNPSGEWMTYGPLADCGTLNRKLLATGFGAGIPHGGGGDNGKDLSKVDMTGIIQASFLAKEISGDKWNIPVLVEFRYKIGDKFPIITSYPKAEYAYENKLSLNDYIEKYNLKEENWERWAKDGGITSAYIMRYMK